MTCSKCGATNPDGALVCRICANPLWERKPEPVREKTIKKRPLEERETDWVSGLLVLCIVLAAALLGLAVFRLVSVQREHPGDGGMSTGEGAVMSFLSASAESNGRGVLELLPPAVLDGLCQKEGTTAVRLSRSVTALLEERSQSMRARFGRWSYACRQAEAETLSRDSLETLRGKYLEEYGIALRDAAVVTVELSVKPAEGELCSWYETLTAVKTGGKWYIDIYSIR